VSRVVNIAGVDRHMKGWRPDKPDPRDRHLMVSEAVRLLDLVDLRPQCPPVVDQGGIGSCTANSSCSAMAFLEHKAKQDTLFSRLFLYAMTRHIEGTPLSEDSGAEIRDVMKALSTYGVPFESEWPYIESKFSTEPPAKAKTDALQHKAVFYYRCPSLYTLKASLHQGFPVVIGFAVPDNMMTSRCAQTGIVLPPAPGRVVRWRARGHGRGLRRPSDVRPRARRRALPELVEHELGHRRVLLAADVVLERRRRSSRDRLLDDP
jgi:hypothetical protein